MTAAEDDIYSRSAGLIENDALMKKRVLIIGLGSFGSVIAVDLAKAAVGHFALMDFDRLERHNVVRHACFLKDVGRLKTDAVEELILGKNPYATVDKFPVDMNERLDLLAQEIDQQLRHLRDGQQYEPIQLDEAAGRTSQGLPLRAGSDAGGGRRRLSGTSGRAVLLLPHREQMVRCGGGGDYGQGVRPCERTDRGVCL